jgi:prepilin-type N-terminal cleavage/methylation domain-containing protein
MQHRLFLNKGAYYTRCGALPRHSPACNKGRSGGFSLIEMLVAIALSAMILILAMQFLTSIAQDWSGRTEERLFDEHVDGVVRFFQFTLNRNVLDERLPTEDRYPALESPPGMSDLNDPMVRIRFPDGSPLFFHPGIEEEPITAWFGHTEEDGVFALWQPDLEEEIDDHRDLYLTPITPWGTAIRFFYFEEADEMWEEEDEVRFDDSNQPLLPDRIQARFRYREGIEKTVTLTLPRTYENVFIY